MTTNAELPKVLGLLDANSKATAGFDINSEIVALARPHTSSEQFSNHIHDLRACARSIKLILQMIEDGDSFDSEYSKTMLAQIKQSMQVLQPTIDFLKDIYMTS